MSDLFLFILVIIFMIIVGFSFVPVLLMLFSSSNHDESKKRISQWFKEQDLKTIYIKYNPNNKTNDYSYSAFRQLLYDVEVEDKNGSIKTGYVILGNSFFGLLSKKIGVKWD